MSVYLSTKFQVSSIILTSFRKGGVIITPTQKQTPKNPTIIRVKKYPILIHSSPGSSESGEISSSSVICLVAPFSLTMYLHSSENT